MMAISLSLKEIQSHPYFNGADETWESSELTTTSLLHSLGWMTALEASTINPGLIAQFVLAAVTARNSCTENDPSSAPGWMSWKEGSRRLREVFRPDGFIKSNDDGVPWLVDPKNGTRFCVANTDEASGVPGRGPQQRSKKGPATDRAVMRNSAPLFEFSGIEEPSLSKSLTRQPFTTQSWYLCIFAEARRFGLSWPYL
jgi:hypothetical protein